METIGLRELNQNPSRAVARVRAGESLLVTDRGKPVLRMVPETEPGVLSRMGRRELGPQASVPSRLLRRPGRAVQLTRAPKLS